jgi:hypothetical protein
VVAREALTGNRFHRRDALHRARFPPAPSSSRYPLPGLPVFLAT